MQSRGRVDHGSPVLSVQGFAESTTGDIQTEFPVDGEPYTELYDYEDDSDLEDDDDDTDDVLAADRKMIRRSTVPTQGTPAPAPNRVERVSTGSRRGESNRASESFRRPGQREDPPGADGPDHSRERHGVPDVSARLVPRRLC
jgi:hypothetical protein